MAAAGEEFNITPYGTETMHVLRAEKGFIIVGQDTDGTVTPQDASMEWVVSKVKDFMGKRSFDRVDNKREDRKQLVTVLPADKTLRLPEGTQLVNKGTELTQSVSPVPMQGFVTSSYHVPGTGPQLRHGNDRQRPGAHRRGALGLRRRQARRRRRGRNRTF